MQQEKRRSIRWLKSLSFKSCVLAVLVGTLAYTGFSFVLDVIFGGSFSLFGSIQLGLMIMTCFMVFVRKDDLKQWADKQKDKPRKSASKLEKIAVYGLTAFLLCAAVSAVSYGIGQSQTKKLVVMFDEPGAAWSEAKKAFAAQGQDSGYEIMVFKAEPTQDGQKFKKIALEDVLDPQ